MTSAGASRRIGLVGCGRWGQHILRDLRAVGAEVDVVARGASADRARAGGAGRVIGDIEDLDTVDGIVIATPTSTHADVIDRCIDREVPLFVEKPMTDDVDRARNIVDRARDRVFVMDKWRYHPGIDRLRALVSAGQIGDVELIRTRRVQHGNPHADVDCAWILLPHDISIVLHVLGEVPPLRSATAVVGPSGLETLSIRCGADGGPSVKSTVSVVAPSSSRRVEVHGSEGTAWLDGADYTTVVVRRGRAEEAIRVSDELPLLTEMSAFVAHTAGGPPPMSSATDGLRTVELVAAARAQAGLAP